MVNDIITECNFYYDFSVTVRNFSVNFLHYVKKICLHFYKRISSNQCSPLMYNVNTFLCRKIICIHISIRHY